LLPCASIKGITLADPVTGPYDVIVTIEVPDQRDIGRLVMNELHGSVEHSITELRVPSSFVGHTLRECDLRRRYGVTVLAVKRGICWRLLVRTAASHVSLN
jgi:Trk K+ transport system NAD-binding subunit